jgi:hypothetical protein
MKGTKEEIIARAMAVSGEQIAEKALREPEQMGRALYQANCARREVLKTLRTLHNEQQIARFENAIKGAA